jgi:hypothetical protein
MHAVFCSPFVRIGPPGHPSQEKSPEDDTKPVYMSYPHLLSAKGGGGGAERGRKWKRTPEAEARGPLPGVACGASALPFVPALGTENCKQSSCCCASCPLTASVNGQLGTAQVSVFSSSCKLSANRE